MSKPIPLEHGATYHLYNRGTNRENLFVEARNYHHFLRLYAQHIAPIADTYAYCLLRNHFHVLLRIKAPEEIARPNAPGLTQTFANFFNAYAKSINRAYGRTGSLFQHPFGRKRVDGDAYFQQLLVYIHQNPQRHGLIDDFRQWPYSSYAAFISPVPTRLQRAEVIAHLGDAAQFRLAHDAPMRGKDIEALIEEDFDE